MSKYYKAEDVIRAIEELPNCYNGWSDTYDKAQLIGLLDNLPTIEVSEDCIKVVRCEDCVYFNKEELGFRCCTQSGLVVKGIDYCSYGERAEDCSYEERVEE